MLQLLKKYDHYYKVAIILIDLLLVNAGYVLAFLIRYQGHLPAHNFVSYQNAIPWITIAAVIIFDKCRLLAFYKKTVYEVLTAIMHAIFFLALTTVTITYYLQGYSFPRTVLLIAPVVQVCLLSIWKAALLKVRRYVVSGRKVMIIGDIKSYNLSINKIKEVFNQDNVEIKYIFDTSEEEQALQRLAQVQEIFLCGDVSPRLRMEIINLCLGTKHTLYIVPGITEISLLNADLKQFQDTPVFLVDKLDLSLEQRFFKRVFDISFSLILILLSGPLMLLIALLIRLTSPGPVIYYQERVTKNNLVFNVYKFRTMVANAEERTGPVLSVEHDPRVTQLGKLLRKLRLDEIPQFFNVLKGEMSVVGPRPERPCFVAQFCKELPEYEYRYTVKAGITGFAQVQGNYSTSAEDKLKYDLMYVRNFSLLLDIKLILQTVRVIFSGSSISSGKIHRNVYRISEIKPVNKSVHG